MEDMVLGRLMQALVNPDVRSLTLAPGREAAIVHVRPAAEQGWVFTLKCRPVLAGLLSTAVARGGGDASTVASTVASTPAIGIEAPDGPPQVQLELLVPGPQLAGRVLDVLLRDHTRTRPDDRLSAFVLEEGEPVARLLELYRPAPHPSRSGTTLVILPAVARAGS